MAEHAVSVIDWARTAKELPVKEAIHIRLNHLSLNRDGGLELPRCRMAALKNTGSGSNQRPVVPTVTALDGMQGYIMTSVHTSFIFGLKKVRLP